jgi:hypothetical protein
MKLDRVVNLRPFTWSEIGHRMSDRGDYSLYLDIDIRIDKMMNPFIDRVINAIYEEMLSGTP